MSFNDSTLMKIPEIEFGTWFKWKERKIIDGSDKPGVYMLSKFKESPSRSANLLDEYIIYFGETCNQSLNERWTQFDASAFQLKRGHSGGKPTAKSSETREWTCMLLRCLWPLRTKILGPHSLDLQKEN